MEKPIAEEYAAFIAGPVSIGVSSCGADRLPSIARGLGCRLAPDRRRLTVYVSCRQAAELIEDIRAGQAIAVVFSRPSTHRTLQLKAGKAMVAAPTAADFSVVEAYRHRFVAELQPLGYAEALIRTVLACPNDELVGLDFAPCEAFNQTPGRDAGARLPEGA